MANTSLVSLRGYFSGLLSGSRTLSPTDMTNLDAPHQVTQITLASGANTITVPSKAKGVIIIFDPTSTVGKTIKGYGDSTGWIASPTGWNVLTFAASPIASFTITASAADTGLLTQIEFF